jgi:hypothetical protein
VVYTKSNEKIDRRQIPFVLRDTANWEQWILEQNGKFQTPGEKHFLKAFEDDTELRSWAEANLPFDVGYKRQTPFTIKQHAFLKCYEFCGYKIPEFETLTDEQLETECLPESPKTLALKSFFKRYQHQIESKIIASRIFGVPVCIVLDKNLWPDAQTIGLHTHSGLIMISNRSDTNLIKSYTRHEIIHAKELYRNAANNNFPQDRCRYYNPEASFQYSTDSEKNKSLGREITRNDVKQRILNVFREEIETYFVQDSILEFSGYSQDFFNYAFSGLYNFDRDARQFNPNYNFKGEFNPPLGQMSLAEIYKYDPEFAQELDTTLRFWRLLLTKSSPEKIEKLIGYVQAASSFEAISVTNLSAILTATETGIDTL